MSLEVNFNGIVNVYDPVSGETFEVSEIENYSLKDLNEFISELTEALDLWIEGELEPSSELGELYWDLIHKEQGFSYYANENSKCEVTFSGSAFGWLSI